MQITYVQKNDSAVCSNENRAASIEDHSAQAFSLQRKYDLVNAAAQRAAVPWEDDSENTRCLQRKMDLTNGTAQRMTTPIPVQRAEAAAPRMNNTGLPDNLKNGVESLSGYSLDDVRVHYNSDKPATVQALAYTQGTDIHVAPGQEHSLPHEAWHVTQQMAGRVSPTTNIGGMPVNDNESLEHEADVMGEKAVQCKMDESEVCFEKINQENTIQRKDPLVKFFEGYHDKAGVQKGVTESDVKEIAGDNYENDSSFHIAFETFGNDVTQLQELYTNVISNYNGKATVVIGLNSEAILNKVVKTGYDGNFEVYRNRANRCGGIEVNVGKVSDVETIPEPLSTKVQEFNVTPKENHKIVICPFIYDGRYKQGGGYNMPYCEIRHKLMQKAEEYTADIYRWIDRDCRDDESIEKIGKLSKTEDYNSFAYTAPYKWRIEPNKTVNNSIQTMVDLVNNAECDARAIFFSLRKIYNVSNYKCYFPETNLYMSKAFHNSAMTKLEPYNTKSMESQSRESEKATQKNESEITFKKIFVCSKPLKNIGTENSYFSSLEAILPPKSKQPANGAVFKTALENLRQTVFNSHDWLFKDNRAEYAWEMYKNTAILNLYNEYKRIFPQKTQSKN